MLSTILKKQGPPSSAGENRITPTPFLILNRSTTFVPVWCLLPPCEVDNIPVNSIPSAWHWHQNQDNRIGYNWKYVLHIMVDAKKILSDTGQIPMSTSISIFFIIKWNKKSLKKRNCLHRILSGQRLSMNFWGNVTPPDLKKQFWIVAPEHTRADLPHYVYSTNMGIKHVALNLTGEHWLMPIGSVKRMICH